MKYQIIFATGNAGKMKEIREILGDSGYSVHAMKEFDLDPEIDENGATFAENAAIKARAVREAYFARPDAEKDDTIVMADDSGLAVDYLNGAPGIYSARFLGEDTPYEIKNRELIDRLSGVPDESRTARFICAIAAILPDGRLLETSGTIEGMIGYEARGTNGFGYDPIFYLPERGVTTAELSSQDKDAISHRGKALRSMKTCISAEMHL